MAPRCYTARDIQNMSQCPSSCPPPNCGSKFITVQQPPKLVCRKNVIYCNRTVLDKRVIPQTKVVTERKLIYTPKTVCEPYVIYKKKVIPEPKVICVKRMVTEPKVMVCPRTITEPKEVCQTMVCHPKPQCIEVPDPCAYNCYPTGSPFSKC